MTPRLLIEPASLAGRSLLRLQSDERLVDLVRAGNDRAFEAIVDRYNRPLLRYCGRLLPPGRVEDVVQQAFLNAFAALRRDEAEIDLRPWLYRIAHNVALNALRENGWSHDNVETMAAALEGPHEVAERRDSLRSVLQAMQTLPPRQRDAMILRELEGRTYAQIAAELHVTGGAVRQLLNRARNKLRAGVTAVTPLGVLARVLGGVTQTAPYEPLHDAAARMAGALLAGVAVLVGFTDVLPQRTSPPAAAPAAPQPAGTGAGAAVPVGDGSVAQLPAAVAHAVRDTMRSVLANPSSAGLGERLKADASGKGRSDGLPPKWPTAAGAEPASSGSANEKSGAQQHRSDSGPVRSVLDSVAPEDKVPAPAPTQDPVATVASVASTSTPSPAPAAESPAPASAEPTLAVTTSSDTSSTVSTPA